MFGDDIAALIRQAKKRRFMKQEAARVKHETELQQFLNRLLSEHRDRQLDLLQSDPQSASSNYAKRKEEIEAEYATRVKQVGEVFDQIDQQRKTRDVPDHLCGKISFELMHEPVITPSGITYDRKDINEHLERVGHFDPITRQPLTASQLIPNLAMKEVVDYYLEDNPWALDGY
jgi:STIP1 family protein 1